MPNITTKELIIAVTTIVITIILGVVALVIFKYNEDTITIIGLMFAFITTTLSSMYAAFKTSETNAHVKGLSISVNGRLNQLLEVTKTSSFAQGKLEGKLEGKSEFEG